MTTPTTRPTRRRAMMTDRERAAFGKVVDRCQDVEIKRAMHAKRIADENEVAIARRAHRRALTAFRQVVIAEATR